MGNCLRKSHEIPITSGSFEPSAVPTPLSSFTKQDATQPKPTTSSSFKPSAGTTPPSSFTKQDATQPKPTTSSSALSKTPSSAQKGYILQKPMVDINSLYTLQKELGRGQFGITHLCTEKATGHKYACKSVSKQKLVRKSDIEDIRREVLILQHLTGQPNIVEFKGAYEDEKYVYLVMELCSGGELFDRITKKKIYSEKKAAAVCRDIVMVVHVCHFMGVIHRDLKPENFLLSSDDDDSDLKATDFGLSVFIEEG